jgi:amino acid transporter
MTHDVKERRTNGYEFGTFKGVFTPSLLTILGVIMYLRFGWVLGNVGLFQTLLIVTISTAITFLTGLSISALATNMRVGGGGTYYIISRSLGLEAGAAVSIPLYLAQSLGIAFYIAGFSELVVSFLPFLSAQAVGMATLLGLAFLSYSSASLALKAQYVILALVGASLISFFAGRPVDPLTLPLSEASLIHPFWVVFAVFFPAVTGIEAGLAMSGDLKDSAKSLPFGTLSAIIVSYLIYMAIPLFMVKMVPDSALLRAHPFIMSHVARFGFLIPLGIAGATLSSALGSLLGAPRTLQALARDKIVPEFIGKGYGAGKDPRIAVLISFLVALVAILAGDLNLIAPILTMFFLTAYGLLNLSAALEGLIASPSWRPKFKVHWGLSLAGALACFISMFMINPGATFLALIVSFGVYFFTKKRQLDTSWSDMRYGILMLVLYFVIHRLEVRKPDARTWRPNLLVLSGPPQSRWHLIELADAIACKRGLLTVATILTDEDRSSESVDNLRSTLRNYLQENNVRALMNLHVASDMLSGAQELVKAHGFGSVAPNTIIIGETEKRENFLEYVKFIATVHKLRRNLVIVRKGEFQVRADETLKMDVLWRGKQKNASLMLALAFLIRMSGKWNETSLVLKTIIQDETKKDEVKKGLEAFIKERRLDALADVIVGEKERDVFETIEENITDANLVFVGMRAPLEDESMDEYAKYYEWLLDKTKRFPASLLVLASEDLEFHKIFTEEKKGAEK